MILDNDTLLMKCAEWGSYIRNGDPGGCMYSFSPGKGFRSAKHAATVYEYTAGKLATLDGAAATHSNIQDLGNIIDTALEYLKRRDAAFDAMLAALKDQIEPRARGWKVTDWDIRDEQARAAIAKAKGE